MARIEMQDLTAVADRINKLAPDNDVYAFGESGGFQVAYVKRYDDGGIMSRSTFFWAKTKREVYNYLLGMECGLRHQQFIQKAKEMEAAKAKVAEVVEDLAKTAPKCLRCGFNKEEAKELYCGYLNDDGNMTFPNGGRHKWSA